MQYFVTVVMIIFDYLSGLAQSVYNSQFSSKIMREGLFKKAAVIAVIVLAAVFDFATQYVDLGVISEMPISSIICTGFIVMEIGSVLENLHKINDSIPSQISELLHVKQA